MAQFYGLSSLATTLPAIAALLVLYYAYLVIYRLFLSPLSKIPGPNLAAITYAYEFYYDVIKRGKTFKQLQILHQQYGPIVRINPHDVHINDPNFFDTIYSSERRDKSEYHVAFNPNRLAGVATVEHDLHRRRRASIQPFFSKGRIRTFSPWIQERANVLTRILEEQYKATDKVLVLNDVFLCSTADIVMEYCFGEHQNLIENENFDTPLIKYIGSFWRLYHISKYIPWILQLRLRLPRWLLTWSKSMQVMFGWRDNISRQVRQIMNNETKAENSQHATVFSEMLTSAKYDEDRSILRLGNEANILVSAATDTTVGALKTAMYYMLANDNILKALKAELLDAIPDPLSIPPLVTLENLPYLSAVISEAIRINALPTRSPRVSPDKDITYTNPMTSKTYLIPAGTPMGTSIHNVHRTEAIFPSSDSFNPSRWLPDPSTGSPPKVAHSSLPDSSLYEGRLLSKYLMSFSKGTRMCLGMNLAMAELFVLIATLVRRFDFELFETGEESVRTEHDFFLPFPDLETKGVRVKVL